MRALTTIGLQTDENYQLVKQELLSFIQHYSEEIKGVNFLNNYVDDLERMFYTQKNVTLSVTEVIQYLAKLGFSDR